MKTLCFEKTIFEFLEKYDGKPCNIMISGGSLLKILGKTDIQLLDTRKWKLFYCDERLNQEKLNYKASIPFLMKFRGIAYPINTSIDPDVSANAYENLLENRKIDVGFFGVGDNGHICSIWPNSKYIESNNKVIEVDVPCSFSPKRITITIKYINEYIKKIYFIIPPKDGKPRDVVEPDESIKKKIKIPYTVMLPFE